MQMVILAGGLATRLRPLTTRVPKSMLEVHGKPFLAYQLELLKRNDITKIVLCVGYLHEQIEDYFGDGSQLDMSISYSYEGQTLLGTGGALKKAEHLLEDEFFVTYGDAYLLLPYQQIWNAFRASRKHGMMVVLRNRNRLDRSNVATKEGLVTYYDVDRTTTNLEYIDDGLSVFDKKALQLLPIGEFVSLGVLFCKLIEKSELAAYETQQRFYEIGTTASLEEFRTFLGAGGLGQ